MQRSLSQCIDEVLYASSSLQPLTAVLKTSVLSSSLPHTGDWLTVVPSAALGLHLSDRKFHPCLQYWLGIHIYREKGICPVSHHLADPMGEHQVGCGGNNDQITHHNFIQFRRLLVQQL